jgi:hypothetical protein
LALALHRSPHITAKINIFFINPNLPKTIEQLETGSTKLQTVRYLALDAAHDEAHSNSLN